MSITGFGILASPSRSHHRPLDPCVLFLPYTAGPQFYPRPSVPHLRRQHPEGKTRLRHRCLRSERQFQTSILRGYVYGIWSNWDRISRYWRLMADEWTQSCGSGSGGVDFCCYGVVYDVVVASAGWEGMEEWFETVLWWDSFLATQKGETGRERTKTRLWGQRVLSRYIRKTSPYAKTWSR